MGMMGGSSQTMTPAQQMQLKEAAAQQADISKTWLPVQQAFAANLRANKPGESEFTQGQAASTARTQGGKLFSRASDYDASHSGLGSGKFFADTSGASNATGAGAGGAESQGALSAQRAYLQGLNTVLGLGMRDQGLAEGQTQTAAGLQQREQSQQAEQALNTQQGLGQIAGEAGQLFGPAAQGAVSSFGLSGGSSGPTKYTSTTGGPNGYTTETGYSS